MKTSSSVPKKVASPSKTRIHDNKLIPQASSGVQQSKSAEIKKPKKKGAKLDPSLLGFISPTRETETVGQFNG